jgi:glycosyltransferase involved in cell wall biosynthesis
MAECVIDGETGLLVDVRDESKLVAAVQSLLQDTSRRKSMGRRARSWVQDNFSIEKVAQQYLAFYEQALGYRG